MRLVLAALVIVSLGAWAQNPPQVEAAPATPGGEAVTQDVLKSFETYWAEGETDPAALHLDVDQCVQMALSQSAQVQVAQDNVDAANAKVGQAKSARMPQVKAQTAFTYIDGLQTFSFAAPSGIFGSLVSSMFGSGSFDQFQGKKDRRTDQVGVTQVLFAGGQIQAAIKASKFLADSQEWQKQAKLNDLAFETRKAYYDCLLARAMVRVAEESVATFKRHLADAQQMLDVGLISNFEVLRAKTEVGAREADLTTAQNAVRLSMVNLRRILALPEDKPLQLVGKMDWTPIELPVDELVRQANDTRPELLALQKGIDAAGQNVKRVRGEYLPKAAANINYSATDNGGIAQPDGWTFSVGAEWELYAGGRRKHEMAEAKAQRSGLEHQMEDVRRLIELDVRAAAIQKENALAQISQEKGTVELGREGRRLAQLRFQEGVGTQVEVLDAELVLSSAESLLVKAVHDCAVAHAAIEKAIAKGVPKPNEAPEKAPEK